MENTLQDMHFSIII
ncbi:DUF5951 family protein [unidentified bacterial endosymbiont]